MANEPMTIRDYMTLVTLASFAMDPEPELDKGRAVRVSLTMLQLGFSVEEMASMLRGFGFTVHA